MQKQLYKQFMSESKAESQGLRFDLTRAQEPSEESEGAADLDEEIEQQETLADPGLSPGTIPQGAEFEKEVQAQTFDDGGKGQPTTIEEEPGESKQMDSPGSADGQKAEAPVDPILELVDTERADAAKEAGDLLIVEKPKEGSSVTQSTVVHPVRLAPNIAEGELSQMQQDSQRDGAALVIQSQSRSPQASLQGPQALSAAAGAQSQSQAQLHEGLGSPLPSGVPAATGSEAKPVEPAQEEQKSADMVHTEAVQGTEPAEHQ